MKILSTFALAAILALPPALAAQEGNASSPSQNSPTVPSATAPQQPEVGTKKDKQKKLRKVKKNNCVSPPSDSGLPDYCRNPYWEPKDWVYIMNNQSGGDKN
jgi:hypothetical protein